MYCSNLSKQVNELVSNGQFNLGTYAAAVPNVKRQTVEKYRLTHFLAWGRKNSLNADACEW